MPLPSLSIRNDFWELLQVQDSDLEFLYNHLLEIEIPQTTEELTRSLIKERIQQEKARLSSQNLPDGKIYLPKEHYSPGEKLMFPALGWKQGKVQAVRPGHNPAYTGLEVIEVEFERGQKKEFAGGLDEHPLNQPLAIQLDDPLLDPDHVAKIYGRNLQKQLDVLLKANPDLVQIAWRWFPRALLVDVNVGHLNLAEAVLDMAGGGPLPTSALIDQIELPTDVNGKLTEFSLNLALQEDQRFDEVGPAGEILWYLHRLEPETVKTPPVYLKFNPTEIDDNLIADLLAQVDPVVIDELEPAQEQHDDAKNLTISLIYPHWKSGTLPLTARVSQFVPTAYESPRIRFTFVDDETGQRFPGWVARTLKYVYGLENWYAAQNLIPGSLIHLLHSKNPGEVIIRADKKRSSKEWIRTALIGADGGIVFAMLKQVINSSFDERMAIAISDSSALEKLWQQGHRPKQSTEQTVQSMLRELAKLNPQGNVHFQELYAAVNLLRRCPPGVILNHLATRNWAQHLGNLYFKWVDAREETNKNE